LRIAALGDIHCSPEHRDDVERVVSSSAGVADMLLLAGDLTTHGEPEQGLVLADACRDLDLLVLAVLGNHDWHANRRDELVAALASGGIEVLDRAWTVREVCETEVGIVGIKGFVGGFTGSHLPDFGEPLLRAVYHETTAEVEALEHGLREVALCPVRIALLHYAPAPGTIEGEPPGIWTFLGSDRLAAPILQHEPDLVLHGHAHAGTFESSIGNVPVYNVAIPVMGRDFWLFELDCATPTRTPIR
jgi:Icc-related predicted phosphoesterase